VRFCRERSSRARLCRWENQRMLSNLAFNIVFDMYIIGCVVNVSIVDERYEITYNI